MRDDLVTNCRMRNRSPTTVGFGKPRFRPRRNPTFEAYRHVVLVTRDD
jgi:hypothetical protein